MPFKQGRRPCLVLEREDVRSFRGALLALGYRFHAGLRSTRRGETQAWLADIGRGRQAHVQEARRSDGRVAVFAHTEPAGVGLRHAISAALDRASFSGGARVLLRDLRGHGWDV
jgi:hypothetical protein